jgi:phosphonate transport system ATP-binding protein
MSASSAADCDPALELRDCSVHYGPRPALQDVTLRIRPGERVALIGPSGAGKTTLLRTLYRSAPQRCALVAQAYDLVPQLSVRANVDAGRLDQRGALYNLTNLLHQRRADREAIAAVLGELGLAEMERRRVGELSGGQQQRVAIARALYARRPILLADEPVAAVDPTRAEDALALMVARRQT